MRIRLQLLGSISVDGDAAPQAQDLLSQPKALALFVYLVLARPGGFHQRDRLVGMLWPETDQERARGSLRKTLQRLREMLGDDVLVARGTESLAVDRERIDCDALKFDAAIEGGALRQALDRYTGDLLPGFFVPEVGGFEDWLESERAYYRDRAVSAAWRLVEIFVGQREFTNATQLARLVARLAPSDERMLRRVVTMLARLEDRAGAMAVYSKFADRLWKEFETRPSPETQRLVQAIRSGAEV